MSSFVRLQQNWREYLAVIINGAKSEIFISSPYVTAEGTNFIASNLSSEIRANGTISILTNLTPQNIIQGATDPKAIQTLQKITPNFKLWHLPSLHAKVYIADRDNAIITSGNLTSGGLLRNFEYGVGVSDKIFVQEILNDVVPYAGLGAYIDHNQLLAYSEVADEIRVSFQKTQTAIDVSIRKKFNELVENAENKLIEVRLSEGPIHTVFSKTILYLLQKHRELTTQDMHKMIAEIHPDLCDDSVYRVIKGRQFGKKWKHAVRSSQVILRRRGLIELVDGFWKFTS